MCGRFVLKAPFSELVRLYNVANNLNLEPRYNIPPTEDIAVVRPNPARDLDFAIAPPPPESDQSNFPGRGCRSGGPTLFMA